MLEANIKKYNREYQNNILARVSNVLLRMNYYRKRAGLGRLRCLTIATRVKFRTKNVFGRIQLRLDYLGRSISQISKRFLKIQCPHHMVPINTFTFETIQVRFRPILHFKALPKCLDTDHYVENSKKASKFLKLCHKLMD